MTIPPPLPHLPPHLVRLATAAGYTLVPTIDQTRRVAELEEIVANVIAEAVRYRRALDSIDDITAGMKQVGNVHILRSILDGVLRPRPEMLDET